MQSSTARALGQLNNNLAADPAEVEPLLEGADNTLDISDFEIIVDREPTLVEKLSELDRELAQPEKEADKKVRKRIGKFRIYTTLIVGGLTTLLVAPQVGLNFLYQFLKSKSADLEAGERESLNQYLAERDRYQHMLDSEKAQLESSLVERNAVLVPEYKKWVQYDDEDSNCIYLHDPLRAKHEAEDQAGIQAILDDNLQPDDDLFCRNWHKYQSDPGSVVLPRCASIAEEGCDIEHKNAYLLSTIREQRHTVQFTSRVLIFKQEMVDSQQQFIEQMHEYNASFDLYRYIALGIVAGGLALAVIGVSIHRGYLNWNNYQDDKDHLQSVGDNVDDEQQRALNSFSIPFNSFMSVTELREEIAIKIDEVEYRARQRAAFLSGKHYSNSPLSMFFKIPNNKDLAKDIFQKAGLYLPKP